MPEKRSKWSKQREEEKMVQTKRRGANGANRAKRRKWSQEEQTKPKEQMEMRGANRA